ncbi:putative calpain-like cysteine peptidase [Trypanosoma cruzi]|uniref:Putative calpain-like cysteine peptidase n=1 Tax=Trypanosoma cruzi TaxID=5693 RepID=A0A2V2VIN5_TRYCR|nr:putative calpain-like cysteine peptidase [Trypanosoma cruzi]
MSVAVSAEAPDSDKVFHDTVFMEKNKHISDRWVRIAELYPDGISQPLLPAEFSREQFGQGNHYECFMLTALSTLVRFPSVIQNCFVSKHVRRDGRYTFQFFRGREWVKVEIDDQIPLEEDGELYIRSSTGHWWPLLLEKAYAKFYTGYENLEGCTLQETYHDLTGNPVLNIPIDAKLAKAAGADVTEGHYWLDLAQKIQSGQFVASVLTKDMETESMGIQREQQYGVLEIFSMTGTSSVNDIVIHLHNPFEDEEFIYTGPLNSKDSQWTPKLRAKYSVDDERSIFLPLSTFLKIINSMQLCYASTIDGDATYFDDEWKGETAGGNPTCVTWRKNPLYIMKNLGKESVSFVAIIKQEDQRRLWTLEDEDLSYQQCGIVVCQYTYAQKVPTYFVTGNNHKPIYKSLFLNSREVANAVTVPPNSLCYLVPSCMSKGSESKFTIALYRMKHQDYTNFHVGKLSVPDMMWDRPIEARIQLQMRTKDRVDFYVDQETDVHILMHQLKSYVSPKTGGDAMAQDYMGMYLYDDADRKIGGVHAATNFRETGIVYHLPRSGRYALSVTCPRAKGKVPALITIVASYSANSRLVEAPEDAGMFEDEDDDIDEGEESAARNNPIDYMPVNMSPSKITELPDSTTPFEDKRFMVDNKIITNDPWIHIGDLYPEGKTLPLLPDKLSRDQFEQGEHFECCCLTAFATLVDHHPDVLRNVFVTKEVRKDGRYTFQFHRYGQWVKVEIDDRIPLTKQQTLFCHSPTRHWWPLLLEKACAKFYTLYQNLEGCTLQELYYDFTGCPVMNIPTDLKLAKSAMYSVDDPEFWLDLNEDLKNCAYGATARSGIGSNLGIQEDQAYGILSVISTGNSVNPELSDLLVMIYNPFVEAVYTGPMNNEDIRWTPELRSMHSPEQRDTIYMPVGMFLETFSSIEKVLIRGVALPGWHFNSEWGEGTNGGNPTLVTWRENPLYLVRNNSEEPLQIMAMIGQPDQRHKLHLLPQQELDYIQCGLVLSQNTDKTMIPTYLLTANNHQMIHKGLYMDFREVANRIVIPPNFFGYLVPGAMFHEQGRFLLSYWYTNVDDEKRLSITRLKVDVARHLPAIAHVTLESQQRKRVDFIVDTPTDAHILLRQEKPYRTANCSDAMTEDFLGMYLYDEHDEYLSGVASATNFRETGIVHHLLVPGRCVLSITCPHANGTVPVRVEIVATEEAHVRTTEPPINAVKLKDVNGELNEENITPPVPQALVGLTSRKASTRTTSISSRIPSIPVEIDIRNQDFSFLDPAPEGIPIQDMLLMGDSAFAASARERMKLKRNPVANASKISALEEEMNQRAHVLAKQLRAKERTFLDPEPEGVPLELLSLNENEAFQELERELRALNRKPRKDAKAIVALEDDLFDRTHVLARELKENERNIFLDPQPEGVPVSELSLDLDEPFHTMEVERLRLRHEDPRANVTKVKELENALNDRAQELARLQLRKERAFQDPEPFGFSLEELGLGFDDAVVRGEAQLRELRKEPKKNAAAIKATEDEISKLVRDIARKKAALDRAYLDPEPEGRLVGELPLDEDKSFVAMDTKRRQLLRRDEDPSKVKALEEEMNDVAHEIARALNAKERLDYLGASPCGVPLEDLPLDLDQEFRELEAKRQQLKRDPRRKAALEEVEAALNARTEEIARRQLAGDRGYLDPAPAGVPLSLLPVDRDAPFQALEAKRAQLKKYPQRNAKSIREVEDDLNDRAVELADELKAVEREKFLNPKPNGVPIDDVPTNNDGPFRDMEIQRLLLREEPVRNATAISNLEDAMNERALELAANMLADKRAFLDPEPLGIPLDDLPIDKNEEFLAKKGAESEIIREMPLNSANGILLKDKLLKMEYSCNNKDVKDLRADYLDPEPEGRLVEDLLLDDDAEYMELEKRLFEAMNSPKSDPNVINALKAELNERAHQVAKALNASERKDYLDPTPRGVPVDDLPLDTDEEFSNLEADRARLRQSPKRNQEEILSIEEALNGRARELAYEAICRDRNYLDDHPEGVPLELLPLNTDQLFQELEKERASILSTYPVSASKLSEKEKALNNRAHELAAEYKKSARKQYIREEEIPFTAENLSLEYDIPFQELEARRFQLLTGKEEHRDHLLTEIEEALTNRAKEIANIRQEEQRNLLDQYPLGVQLTSTAPKKNAEFLQQEEELRQLQEKPQRQAELPSMEKELQATVNAMPAKKTEESYPYIEANPEGIHKQHLELNKDSKFLAMEQERRQLLEKDPRRNARRLLRLRRA